MISHKINLIIATSLVVLITHVGLYDEKDEECKSLELNVLNYEKKAEECKNMIIEFCGNYTEIVKCFEYLYFNVSYADFELKDSIVINDQRKAGPSNQQIAGPSNVDKMREVADILTEFFEQLIIAIEDNDSIIHPHEFCSTKFNIDTEDCQKELESVFYNKYTTHFLGYFKYAFLYIKTETTRMANDDTSTSINTETTRLAKEDKLTSISKPRVHARSRSHNLFEKSIPCCGSSKTLETKEYIESARIDGTTPIRNPVTTMKPADYRYQYMKFMFVESIDNVKIILETGKVKDFSDFCDERAVKPRIKRNKTINGRRMKNLK